MPNPFAGIERADRAKIVWLFCYLTLAVGGTVVFGRSVGRAVFLGALPPEAVPLKLVVSAVAVVGATALYQVVGRRMALTRLVVASQLVLTGGVLLSWLAARTPLGATPLAATAIFGWLEVVAALVTMQFWVLAGQLFDPRSARRSFALITAGGPVATLGGGSLLGVLAPRVSTADLLLLTAIGVLLCALTTAVLARRYADLLGAGRPKTAAAPKTAAPPPAATRSPLARAIVGIVLLGSTVTALVDYQMDLAMQVSFAGNPGAMSGFLGTFNAVAGGCGLLIQVSLVSVVLERFGLRATLSLLPAGFAAGAVAVVASGGALLPVAGARAADMLFRFTFNDVGVNILYLPLGADARRRLKESLDGVLKPVTAAALAGVLALARAAGWQGIALWSLPVLAMVIAWFWLVARAQPAYQQALVESLRRRRLSFDDASLDAADPGTRLALLAALHGPDEALALAALSTIAEAPGDWASEVARLLGGPSTELRGAAARYLAAAGERRFAADLAGRLADPAPSVRAAVVTALGELGGDLGPPERLLADEAPEVRRAAVAALLRRGEPVALDRLHDWTASDDPAERRAAAEAIGSIGRGGWDRLLAALLDDPRPEVEQAALRAVGAVGAASLLEPVVARLGAPATANAAADALLALAEDAEAGVELRLVGCLRDEAESPGVRRGIPRVLVRLSAAEALEPLLEMVADPDPELRGAVYAALAQAGPLDEAAHRRLAAQVEPELRDAYRLRAVWTDLGPDGRGDLLGEGLDARYERALGRVFELVGVLQPGAGLADAWRAVRSGDPRHRANAVEVVDGAVDRAWRADLTHLLEAAPERAAELARQRYGEAAASAADRLRELAGDDRDPWLRACALERIGRLGLTELGGELARGLRADDRVVRETALIAAQAVMPPERVIQLLDEPVAI